MGETRKHRPVLLVMAAFGKEDAAIDEGRRRAAAAWGGIVCEAGPFPFDQTTYYERSMGAGLKKRLWAFRRLIDPTDLPAIKHQTNEWEEEIRRSAEWSAARPVNLDPGYVTEAKLVLATTKDRDHRLYLGDGIFGEVTLHFHGGEWRAREWTYADYRQPSYFAFLDECRALLRSRYRDESGSHDGR